MSLHFSFTKLVNYKSSTFAAMKLPKHAVEWSASMAPPTHPVESVAVVTPVVSLHQHLSQAVGMMRLGAHGDHTPLDEGLHLRLANQTSARGGEFGFWLVEPEEWCHFCSRIFYTLLILKLWNHRRKKILLGQHRWQMFHFLQKDTQSHFWQGKPS